MAACASIEATTVRCSTQLSLHITSTRIGPLAPNPLLLMPSTAVAQQHEATASRRRGCNYAPNSKRDVNDVWRQGKHEATVRDPFFSNHGFNGAAGTEHCFRSFLFFHYQTLDPNNVQLSHCSAVAIRERAIVGVSADPPICYKHHWTYKSLPGFGSRATSLSLTTPTPTMPSSSARRFAPYPHSKPIPASVQSRHSHPTSLFASSTNHPFWLGQNDTHTTGFEPQQTYPAYWETCPFEPLQTSSFAPGAQSGSPCSDDSAVTTPVSAVFQLPPQPLIRGVDYGVPGSGEHGLLTLPAFDIFQSNNGQMAVPASYSESIANMGQGKVSIDYHQPQLGSLDDSYSLLHHHQLLPTKPGTDRVCSFAKTSPQFISPFSDSAVTSQPQLLPLYAPKPVRPIPKVCFTPPEDDPLPPSSLLYQPVSRAVRETVFRRPPQKQRL